MDHAAGAKLEILEPVQVDANYRSERKFAFVAEWNIESAVYEQLTSRVSLVIRGAGFGSTSRYFVRLTAGSNILDSAPVFATAESKLLILTEPWNFGVEVPAAITVHREGSNELLCRTGVLGNCAPSSVYVNFFNEWYALDRTFVWAKGGDVVRIRGVGFETGATGYTCEFATYGYAPPAVVGSATSPIEVLCISPVWFNRSAAANVTVLKDGVPLHHAGPAADRILVVAEGWDTIAGGPVSGPASGSTVVSVQGFGFDPTAADYKCAFTRGTDTRSVSATVVTYVLIECATPAWGATLVAEPGAVSVSVTRGAQLPYTANGATAQACALEEGCAFQFKPVWSRFAASSPTEGSGSGGTSLVIEGSGLNPATRYRCRFDGAAWTETSTLLNAVSVSRVLCTTTPVERA